MFTLPGPVCLYRALFPLRQGKCKCQASSSQLSRHRTRKARGPTRSNRKHRLLSHEPRAHLSGALGAVSGLTAQRKAEFVRDYACKCFCKSESDVRSWWNRSSLAYKRDATRHAPGSTPPLEVKQRISTRIRNRHHDVSRFGLHYLWSRHQYARHSSELSPAPNPGASRWVQRHAA